MYKFLPATLIGIIALLTSCANNSTDHRGLKRRTSEHYYQSSGASLYFLNDLPSWANYSTAGSCQRQTDFRWLNYQQVRDSFSLNYHQMVQLQYRFNTHFTNKVKTFGASKMPLAQKERLFNLVVKEIQGGIFEFRMPKYHRIHMVWIDPFIGSDKQKKELAELVQSDAFGQGYPVFISLCLSSFEMEELAKELLLFDYSIRNIPTSMFSIYGPMNKLNPHLLLDLNNFFPAGKELHFFLESTEVPVEIQGEFTIHKLQ